MSDRPGEPAYFANLNPPQRQAVETLDGPVLVLAGAGTGKTRVLTTRLGHILLSGRAYPSQVLAVTFTNKAAREMRERLERLIGADSEGMWLGTFHAIAARILRRNAEAVNCSWPRVSTTSARRPAPCWPRSSAGRIAA
jgi:DNA helicase-2/ATP-dependent DNA helicase PcrA